MFPLDMHTPIRGGNIPSARRDMRQVTPRQEPDMESRQPWAGDLAVSKHVSTGADVLLAVSLW
jgi:hypothetical protein